MRQVQETLEGKASSRSVSAPAFAQKAAKQDDSNSDDASADTPQQESETDSSEEAPKPAPKMPMGPPSGMGILKFMPDPRVHVYFMISFFTSIRASSFGM